MLGVSLVLLLLLLLHASTKEPSDAQWIIGIPGNVLSFLTAGSPLLQLKTILRQKDASCLPFGMSVMNVVAGGVWMVYGIMLKDPLVIYPNMFALTMGIIQVSLLLWFPGKQVNPKLPQVPARPRHKSEHESA